MGDPRRNQVRALDEPPFRSLLTLDLKVNFRSKAHLKTEVNLGLWSRTVVARAVPVKGAGPADLHPCPPAGDDVPDPPPDRAGRSGTLRSIRVTPLSEP